MDIAKMLVGLKADVNAANKVSLKRGKKEIADIDENIEKEKKKHEEEEASEQ